MARWGFWDWVAYLCLGIAAVALAIDTALKQEPNDVLARLPDFFTSPRWAYVPIILFALGSFILAVRFAAPLLLGESVSRGSKEKVFVDETPQFLMDLTKGHTAVQQKKITEIYIGKWLRISGPVANVYPTKFPRGTRVMVRTISQHAVWLEFGRSWVDRTGLLRIDRNISAFGKITEIRNYDIQLKHCELLEPLSLT